MAGAADLILGFDSSTQGLKVTAIQHGAPAGGELSVYASTSVNYEADLPRFGTKGGMIHRGEGEVLSPTLMWVEALDLALRRLREDGFPFHRVAATSGSGQQHGSVFWRDGAAEILAGLDPAAELAPQLSEAFAREMSPIWADSSTAKQCAALEAALGGAQAVSDVTGSRAYERFTGNQIAKVSQLEPEVYARCERVSLVSSFMASLLIGAYAPIDFSDGSGMNLLDVRQRSWSKRCLDACAPGLVEKLGAPVASHTVVGSVSSYLVKRYGFRSDCAVVAWSGDNPCSVAGIGLSAVGDVGVSLGTSDTLFAMVGASGYKPGTVGHVFASPVDPNGYMVMLCYKNGSLVRERIRNANCPEREWACFDEAVARVPQGNTGVVGFFFDDPEITPRTSHAGTKWYGADGAELSAAPAPDVQCRAVLESRVLAMRTHYHGSPRRVIATGGASQNATVLQLIADVFGCPVLVGPQADSASLGAAFRALHGWRNHGGGSEAHAAVAFEDAVKVPGLREVATPDEEAHAIYASMLDHFRACEAKAVEALR